MWLRVHVLGNIVLIEEEVVMVATVTVARVSALHHSAGRRWRSSCLALKGALQCYLADDMRLEAWKGSVEG